MKSSSVRRATPGPIYFFERVVLFQPHPSCWERKGVPGNAICESVTGCSRGVSFGTKSHLGSLHVTHPSLPICRWKRTGRRSIVGGLIACAFDRASFSFRLK